MSHWKSRRTLYFIRINFFTRTQNCYQKSSQLFHACPIMVGYIQYNEHQTHSKDISRKIKVNIIYSIVVINISLNDTQTQWIWWCGISKVLTVLLLRYTLDKMSCDNKMSTTKLDCIHASMYEDISALRIAYLVSKMRGKKS